MEWSEFYFVLQPSKRGGIGVFAAVDIELGVRVSSPNFEVRTLKKEEIPSIFHKYCIHKNDREFFCPPRFDCMQIGWFINHSNEANVIVLREKKNYKIADEDHLMNPETMFLVTSKKVFAGDEILIDYNNLNEPEHLKEAYYSTKDAIGG